jgi:NAD-dependent deacetylase
MSLNSKEKQTIDGDQNTQINSGKDTVSATGEGSIAAIGNVNITHGIDADYLAKFALELIEQHNIKNQANKTSIIDKKVVVLTGAGISRESGISTFEDDNGLWNGFKRRELATKAMWDSDRKVVWEYYQKRRIQLLEVRPNHAHFALQELSKKIKEFILITQNVDDLHERAGSSDVLHMHGSLQKLRCEKTGKSEVKMDRIHFNDQLLYCDCCHEPSVLRPDIVWYEEQIQCSNEITRALSGCDILIVVGTSGRVYPAASYVDQARINGAKTILVNLRPPKNIESFNEIHLGNASTLLPELVKKWT